MANSSIPPAAPFFQLLRDFDALAIALNRFRQRSFELPQLGSQSPKEFDWSARDAGEQALRDEFNAVRAAVLRDSADPAARYAALRDEVIAEFARRGERDPDLVLAISRVAEWLGIVCTPWMVWPTAYPYSHTMPEVRAAHDAFERGQKLGQDYLEIRARLLHCVSRTGITIPDAIRVRDKLAFDSWQADTVPITQEELLALAQEVPHDATAPTPTVPDSPRGFLGGAALADALGIHATRRAAFFRRLDRQRMSLGDDCWHEVRDPRPHSPRFLYRAESPKLRDLAAEYQTPKPT